MNNLTQALAIDCEMVGAGPKGSVDIAGRVSLVNENGKCIFDTFIKPNKKVTDYRTLVSGITPKDLAQGRPIDVVKRELVSFIKKRILVGYSVEKKLKVFGLSHPKYNIRDTACYPSFQTRRGPPSLKHLAAKHLGWSIQNGLHSSVQDASAAMGLYKKVEVDWEEWLQSDRLTCDLTEAIAMECEDVGAGPEGSISVAARVTLIDEDGRCVFDAFITPNKEVTDYRSSVTGITAEHVVQGHPLSNVKRQVANYIRGRILVGQCVEENLKLLGLCHPEENICDLADCSDYQTDAIAAMRLFKLQESDSDSEESECVDDWGSGWYEW